MEIQSGVVVADVRVGHVLHTIADLNALAQIEIQPGVRTELQNCPKIL